MPRVLLIRPLCEGEEPEFSEPLGIERLAGYLRAHGISEAWVLDRRLYERERATGVRHGSFWEDMRKACAAGPPDWVGVSHMTAADVTDARRVLSRLHAFYPAARFVAGGVYVTTNAPEAATRLPHDTVLLRGEGEAALLSLVLEGDASECYVAPNDWAMPYRPNLERYAALGCAVSVQTSRGCPGRCTFCATPSLPRELRTWCGRDVGLVADELQQMAERLASAGLPPIFNFVDDDFGPLDRLEGLAHELDKRGLVVAFACDMRLASLIGQGHLEARLSALAQAGLTRVFFGVESLDLATLRTWRKGYDMAGLPEVLRAFEQAGIAVQTGYILWHAGQTVEGALREVRALKDLGIYSHRAALSRLIVFPGCELARCAADVGGFQRMGEREERFYHAFAERSTELTERWTNLAIAEPYEAAQAHLAGSHVALDALRAELHAVNDRSYDLFVILLGANS